MSAAPTTRATGAPEPAAPIRLWPFGVRAALLAVGAVWILLGAFFWVGHRWMDWPTAAASGGLVYIAAVVGLVPIVLLVLDVVAQRSGALATKWFTVDFGRSVPDVDKRRAVEIETSLGFQGQPLNDSSVATVHETLASARSNDIVRLDLGRGENWWMTRLFALCAGAAQTGAPEVLVFVGTVAGIKEAFVGWTRPRDAFRLIRAHRDELRLISDRASSIGRYLTTVSPPANPAPPPPAVPPPPAPPGPPPDPRLVGVLDTPPAAYANIGWLGEETTLRILLDLLGRWEQAQQPADPERVTPGILEDVLGTDLRREHLDLQWPKDRQLAEFLASTCDYLALVDGRKFQSLVHRRTLENAILRQLAEPAPDAAAVS